MFKERIFIGSVAVVLGIMLAALAFYIWQSTKVIPQKETVSENEASPTSTPSSFLIIDSPVDESVVDKRIIQVSGKGLNTKEVIISTKTQDLIIKPASDGGFATNITLSEGVNSIYILAIMKNGESVSQTRTVTFTTETF